jgi:hypothetical protein
MNSVIFSLLFAVYPIVFIAVANPGQAFARTITLAIVAVVIATLLVLAMTRLLLKTWHRAALATSVLIALFYAYGPMHTFLDDVLHNSLNEITGIGMWLQRVSAHLHPLLTVVFLACAFAGVRGVSRLRDDWILVLVRAANAASFVMIGLISMQWVARSYTDARDSRPVPIGARHDVQGTGVGNAPDLYMIILDGYARADVLRTHYGFDNSAFLNDLTIRGFQVSEKSTANYNWTFLSLASTLNMQYLQSLLGDRVSPDAKSRAPVYDAVRNNAVARFLRQRGYRVVHFQSTWGATLHNPYADQQVPCHPSPFIDEFYRVLTEASWLKALSSKASADLASCYESNLRNLGAMGRQPGPKFVFVHFLPPHHPYLFDREGRVLRNANLSNQFDFQARLWEQKSGYIDQLIYMNRRITQAVDDILAASPHPPIIIIESDHGPNLTQGLDEQERIRVRLSNLRAVYLPGAPPELIPSDASLVNQFRFILNFYFGQNMDILPNTYYLSPYGDPYNFKPVNVDR